MESILGGSATGALLFGFPYESPGIPDLLVIILIFIIARKLLTSKEQADNGKDIFNLPNQRSWPGQNKDLQDSETKGNEPPNTTSGRNADNSGEIHDGRKNNNGGLPPHWQGKGSRQRPPMQKNEEGMPPQQQPQNMKSKARATWDALRSNPPQGNQREGGQRQNAGAWPGLQNDRTAQSTAARSSANFDENDFLAGARALYVRLQTSWAARDVDDLEPFMTDSMMNILQEQAKLNPDPIQVQVLMVTASLADVADIARTGETRASVTFDAVIHEGPSDQGSPLNVHELWHFVRNSQSGGSWRLDSINQE